MMEAEGGRGSCRGEILERTKDWAGVRNIIDIISYFIFLIIFKAVKLLLCLYLLEENIVPNPLSAIVEVFLLGSS